MTNCSSCGYEVRNIQAASAVQELVRKLEQIDSQKAPIIPIQPIDSHIITDLHDQESESIMKKTLGWDFNERKRIEAAKEAREAEIKAREKELKTRLKDAKVKGESFEEQKKVQKANLILNFPIPNTKEDIMEFALLVSSNINIEFTIPDIVSRAWMTKLEQIYKKADISFQKSSDFEQVSSIYQQIKQRWKRIKAIQLAKHFAKFLIRNIGILCGLTAFLVAIFLDNNRDDSEQLFELIGAILLIASACTLKKRTAHFIEVFTAILGGTLSFVLANFLRNGSMLQLTGAVVLIAVVYNTFGLFTKHD